MKFDWAAYELGQTLCFSSFSFLRSLFRPDVTVAPTAGVASGGLGGVAERLPSGASRKLSSIVAPAIRRVERRGRLFDRLGGASIWTSAGVAAVRVRMARKPRVR